jgi:5-formyltetrahydrofolate cyclo-ligase
VKTEPSHKQDKHALRRTIRRARTALSPDERQFKDRLINRAILQYIHDHRVKAIGAYCAFDGEPSLEHALQGALAGGCRVALPVIIGQAGKSAIEFRLWEQDTPMQANCYGIAEPRGTQSLRATDLDLLLLPLVGWDTTGRRLGMGAGFYDRYLQPWAASPRPVRAGVAYDLQQQESLPDDPWDVPLHLAFSESGMTSFHTEEKE